MRTCVQFPEHAAHPSGSITASCNWQSNKNRKKGATIVRIEQKGGTPTPAQLKLMRLHMAMRRGRAQPWAATLVAVGFAAASFSSAEGALPAPAEVLHSATFAAHYYIGETGTPF